MSRRSTVAPVTTVRFSRSIVDLRQVRAVLPAPTMMTSNDWFEFGIMTLQASSDRSKRLRVQKNDIAGVANRSARFGAPWAHPVAAHGAHRGRKPAALYLPAGFNGQRACCTGGVCNFNPAASLSKEPFATHHANDRRGLDRLMHIRPKFLRAMTEYLYQSRRRNITSRKRLSSSGKLAQF